ncbi:MAG TPA: hypothetical protein VMU87_13525 [Stellaceae bacterium]|nr:hypothetical protein [Stellaceae bacterium]
MLETVWRSADRDGSRLLRSAAALAAAVARLPVSLRATAAQDGLDLLAVLAGLKPLCLAGRGGAFDAEFRAALVAAAAAASLPVLEAAPWEPQAAPGVLPDWYRAATAQRCAKMRVLYLCRDVGIRDAAAALSAQGRVAAADEAALLGYPLCCVVQHHRQALGLEQLTIAMTARVAQGDPDRMARLIEAGVEPLPASAEEWRDYRRLTAIAPAPATSVNMCAACAGDDASPAAALARSHAALAAATAYPLRN